MAVSNKQKLILAFYSGGICAKCKERLLVDEGEGDAYHIGEAAHIEGEHDGKGKHPRSARYNPDMTDDERNSYKNLIYLCPTCHRTIDKIPEGEQQYPVAVLAKLKREHEGKVIREMTDAFPKVTFKELLVVTKWASDRTPSNETANLDLLGIRAKLKRNNISDRNLYILKTGLGIADEVVSFIREIASDDIHFPERLKTGFLSKYYDLKSQDLEGDALFSGMCIFAQRGFEDPVEKAAALAVLMHYFESCEIFEK